MILIEKNIERKLNQEHDWFKDLDLLVGEKLQTTLEFDNAITVGSKIVFNKRL